VTCWAGTIQRPDVKKMRDGINVACSNSQSAQGTNRGKVCVILPHALCGGRVRGTVDASAVQSPSRYQRGRGYDRLRRLARGISYWTANRPGRGHHKLRPERAAVVADIDRISGAEGRGVVNRHRHRSGDCCTRSRCNNWTGGGAVCTHVVGRRPGRTRPS